MDISSHRFENRGSSFKAYGRFVPRRYWLSAGLVSLVSLLCSVAGAATYYVSPDGDDGSTGDRANPWRSPLHASQQARAGDTVIFLPGEYTDPLVPVHSGTPDAPITYKASERRQARLVGGLEKGDNTPGDGYRIWINEVSGITIEGFYIQDISENDSVGGWLRMDKASGITIRDCRFTGGAIWIPFNISNSKHVRILQNDFSRDQYGGDMWRVDGTRQLLIESNSFSRSLHTLGRPQNSQQVVIRGNVFHSGWSRNFAFYTTDDSLIENNLFTRAYNGGRSAGPINQLGMLQRMIFRYNQTVHNLRAPLSADAHSSRANLHNRYYNNVFHGNYGRAVTINSLRGNFRDFIMKNSIFDRNDHFSDGTQLALTGGGPESIQLIRNDFYSGSGDPGAILLYGRTPLSLADAQGEGRWSEYVGQAVTRVRQSGRGLDLPVESAHLFVLPDDPAFSPGMIGVGEDKAIALIVGVDMEAGILHLDRELAWEAGDPVFIQPDFEQGEVFVDNLNLDPAFVDPANFHFALREDSPLLNAGDWLTHTVEGGSGRQVVVEDAYYFYDGYGIAGELGDVIAIGSSANRARVVSVDHAGKVLHLDRDLEWGAGDPVSFPWSGEAPDLGIYEHGDSGRVSVQVLADPVFTEPGKPVRLRAVVRGMESPERFVWHLGDGTLAEGEAITHVYQSALDFGVRVRVTGEDGQTAVGVGYVNAEPPAPEDYLIHTTFDADDEDWWVHWQFYRGRRATGFSSYRHILDEETGQGYHEITSLRGRQVGPLPAFFHPRYWNIDEHPYVRIRYRIRPGSPIAIFVRPYPSAYHVLWDMDQSQDTRRYYFAGTDNVLDRQPLKGDGEDPRPRGSLPEAPFEQILVDDGEWHEIAFDVRDIRKRFPAVNILEAIHIGDLEVDGGRRVGRNDAFWLDEIYIGKHPEENQN